MHEEYSRDDVQQVVEKVPDHRQKNVPTVESDEPSTFEERAEDFLHALDENYSVSGRDKGANEKVKDACDEFFRPYREAEGDFGSLLRDDKTLSTALSVMAEAYWSYKEQVDGSVWEDRQGSKECLQEFLSGELAKSLNDFDAWLDRDDRDKDERARVCEDLLYVVSEALDTEDARNRKNIESWIGRRARELAILPDLHERSSRAQRTALNIMNRSKDFEAFNEVAKAVVKGSGEISSAADFESGMEFLRGSDVNDSYLRVKQRILTRIVADKIGLDPSIVEKWKESDTSVGKDEQGNDRYRTSCAEALEASLSIGKDAANRLFSEYGIANFQRYDSSLLLWQLEQSGQDIPYGVIVFPEEDLNGAFAQMKTPIAEMAAKLRMEKFATRIVEVGSKTEFAKRLLSLDKRYGSNGEKISFMVLGGHGSSESITFGDRIAPPPIDGVYEDWELRRGKITTSDLTEGKGIESALRRLLRSDAPIVLISCSTGKEGGIAEQASRKAPEREMIGPDRPVSVRKIDVEFTEVGTPILTPEYYDPDVESTADADGSIADESKAMRYVGGELRS
ncbi:MAG: hypothetical protein HGA33_05030 [Candidatus Moranbacteria bacterium]|nr:hypothetical protein [Candidatus Moranbacteria bacterium]